MKISIMQPYFFPYIGYWQLINASDLFIVFDDVNYIKRGWIHRNRILQNGVPRYINLPIKDASQNRIIRDTLIYQNPDFPINNLRMIKECYGKSGYYGEVISIIENALHVEGASVGEYLYNQIMYISKSIGIDTEIVRSSSIEQDSRLHGENKIIALCKKFNADMYINPIGGIELYDSEHFKNADIELRFLKSELPEYKQLSNEFTPALSIIDVLMCCGLNKTTEMLGRYSLISM